MANIIFARSPYIIEIKVATQTATRLTLDISSSGGTLLKSYSFSKNIASSVNYGTYYNISNFVLEYLNNINPDYSNVNESANIYCSVVVRKYRTIGGVEAEVGLATTYLAVDGYTEYMDGMNSDLNVDLLPMTSDLKVYTDDTIYTYTPVTQIIHYNPSIDQFYTVDNTLIKADSSISINSLNSSDTLSYFGSYIDVLLQKSGSNTYSVKYTDGSATNSIDITPANTNPIVKKVFLQSPYWNSTFPYRVGLYRGSTLLWERTIDADEECKYTPLLCSFISKKGGWENVYFMKAKEESSTMGNTTYNLLQDYNYNYLKGQKKAFNTNGNDFIKCNTGWVDESMNIILKDLLFSETILLDSKPVLIKNKSITYKNTLKDRLINYEMEFEYAYNLINNVV
jgi:hypothetical protein